MIDIKCEDDFLKKNIVSLIEQKKFYLKNDYSNKFFFQLEFYHKENFLYCLMKDEQIKINIPKNFHEIFEKIYDFVSNKSIYLNSFKFYPFKQLMINEEKNTQFSDIQNKIMIHLLLNLDKGIEKIVLIKNIWPKDKEIFLNKLDTHLTNLKNQIFRELGFDLKFSSKSGILKLIIN
tara:strand:+ start:470 stop:1000 length:531 start_codon:yes stop_codon:yes gene_type:complete